MEKVLVRVTFNTKHKGKNCVDKIENQACKIIKRHTPDGMMVYKEAIQKLIKHTEESWSIEFMLINKL